MRSAADNLGQTPLHKVKHVHSLHLPNEIVLAQCIGSPLLCLHPQVEGSYMSYSLYYCCHCLASPTIMILNDNLFYSQVHGIFKSMIVFQG